MCIYKIYIHIFLYWILYICIFYIKNFIKIIECIYFFFFVFSRATPASYGGSQARGPIGAIAAAVCQRHSNGGSEPRLQPAPQLTAMPDP